MSGNRLHIVSFDIPYPPDYGGAIDVFYKIKALAEAGMKIYLHCFEYGREHSNELEQYCEQVWYYPRHTGIRGLSLRRPYIVNSRKSKLLLSRLQEIDAPILFEGVHTSCYLNDAYLKNRVKIIRAHNIEHEYYRHLYVKESNLFRKLFFKTESNLLKSYEYRLGNASGFATLSIADADFFKKQYPLAATSFIAPFHAFDEVTIEYGKGDYVLYHGNLSHPENREAALYLLHEVFPHINTKAIIAGTNPNKDIIDACNQLQHVTLVINPSRDEMSTLIREAHIHTLPTFQATGMKLKLLYALFAGRHVIVNKDMLHGTGLDTVCTIANDASSFIHQINLLADKPFTAQDAEQRKSLLADNYDNKKNAELLIKSLAR